MIKTKENKMMILNEYNPLLQEWEDGQIEVLGEEGKE